MVVATSDPCWASYDHLFREYAALVTANKMDWTRLELGLHHATYMRQAGQRGTVCSHCRETNHSDHECALDRTPAGQDP